MEQTEFSTSDPEHAAATIQDSYRVTGGVRISDYTDGFTFAQEARGTAEFAVTRFQCSATVDYHGPLGGLLCVEQVHAGRLSVRTADADLRTVAGDICLIPPHEPWQATTQDIDMAPLMLDRERVATYAATVGGIEPGAFRFTGLEPISPARARHWHATVAHIGQEVLANPEVAAEPLVRAEVFRTLVSGMLTLFPNTAVAALGETPAPGSGRAGPAVLRRALAFIDDNAHRPIGLTEIAQAARIGPRVLQDLFLAHQGRTPLEHLRQVRLARAHTDLVAADPARGDTVAAIAARWGFTRIGLFTLHYRRTFGYPPVLTLDMNGSLRQPGGRSGLTLDQAEQTRARADEALADARSAHERAVRSREEAEQTRLRILRRTGDDTRSDQVADRPDQRTGD